MTKYNGVFRKLLIWSSQKKIPMLKHKTSILFVNSDGKDNKVMQIPTKILLHWKKYFTISICVILVSVGLLGVIIYQKTSDHYKEQLAKANKIKSLIDIKKAKESFKSIDESMMRINQFLEARGLTNFKLKNSGGGDGDFEITDINEISKYYEEKIKNIEYTVKITPIGKPFNGEITSGFGYRYNPFTGYSTENHPGIDFRGKIGDPVKTTANGIVEFAGSRGGYGNCIIIKHNENLKTLYGHLSKILVSENQDVKIGDLIGKIGSTGRSTGPHLHYEIIKNDEKINPIDFTKL